MIKAGKKCKLILGSEKEEEKDIKKPLGSDCPKLSPAIYTE